MGSVTTPQSTTPEVEKAIHKNYQEEKKASQKTKA